MVYLLLNWLGVLSGWFGAGLPSTMRRLALGGKRVVHVNGANVSSFGDVQKGAILACSHKQSARRAIGLDEPRRAGVLPPQAALAVGHRLG